MRKKGLVFLIVFLQLVITGCQTSKTIQEPISKKAIEEPKSETEKQVDTSIPEDILNPKTEVSKDKKHQSIWSVDSSGEKKLVTSLSEGLGYDSPAVSPDKTKIALFRITESLGDVASGIPVIYNIQDKTLSESYPKVKIFTWSSTWFNDSKALLMDGKTIFDLKTSKTVKLKGQPENIGGKNNLGGKPSPDGSKIAVFSSENSEGVPLRLLLYDRQGNILKTIKTKLEPQFSNNFQSAVPVQFEWLSDSESIVLEGWNQQEDSCNIYHLNTSTGSVKKIVDYATSPTVHLKDNKIAVLDMDNENPVNHHGKIGIYDLEGKLISESNFQIPGLHLGRTMEWDRNGRMLFVSTSFVEGDTVKRNGVIVWDTEDNIVGKTIYIPENTSLIGMYPDGEAIFVMDWWYEQ